MKNIQNFLAAIIFFLLFLSFPTYGQNALQNRFDMELTQFRRDRDKIHIEGTIFLKGITVSASNQLTITPEVRSAG